MDNYKDNFYIRNHKPYKDNFSLEYLIVRRINIFSYKDQIELVQFIRNYFCENIAFYFLWLISYTRFLVILAIFSTAVYGIVQYEEFFQDIKTFSFTSIYKSDSVFTLDFLDLIYLVFCVIVGIWSTIYFSYWENCEEYYAYLWGTQNIESIEPFRKEFQPDKKDEFVFYKKVPSQFKWKKILKQLVSTFCIIIMGGLTILIANGLLTLNPDNTSTNQNFTNFNKSMNSFLINTTTGNNTYTNNTIGNGTQTVDDILKKTDVKTFLNNPWPIMIGIFNGIQIEIMSWGYAKLARLLNDWENHEKESEYENNYIIKIMVFDFVNNFNSLFNIAFVKVNYLIK